MSMQTRSPRVPWWRPLALVVVAVPSIFMLTPEHALDVMPVVDSNSSEREQLQRIERELQALKTDVALLSETLEQHDANSRTGPGM
jgi:hypothetical protein